MSAHAVSADPGRGGAAPDARRLGASVVLGAAVGAGLAAIAFAAKGGLELDPTATVEIVLTLGAGLIVAASLLATELRPRYGLGTVMAFALLAALTGASVLWSVQPSDSWIESGRTFAYLAVFGIAMALVRWVPARWSSVVVGILIAGVAVCGWALLTKVFPDDLNPHEIYARLRQPYGYWNSVGLTAAMAVPAALWLGTRRGRHAGLTALAFPALGVLLVAMMLSYSRGSLVAMLLGCALWFAAVPRRLRGAAVLGVSALGAAPIVAWVFSTDTLTKNRIDPGLRADAGHELGVLLVLMVGLLLAAGLMVGFLADRRPLGHRAQRQVGIALLVALALVPVGVAAGLASSHRGLTGTITHDWNSLTNPNARTPPNDPSRLTAVASVRARYWNEALEIFRDHPVAGVGADGYATARLRYRNNVLQVHHAHGYVVQTLSDLGLVGAGVTLLLLAAWVLAALRSSAPFGWPGPARGRLGLGLLARLSGEARPGAGEAAEAEASGGPATPATPAGAGATVAGTLPPMAGADPSADPAQGAGGSGSVAPAATTASPLPSSAPAPGATGAQHPSGAPSSAWSPNGVDGGVAAAQPVPGRGWRAELPAEQIGLITLLSIVLIFGLHSLVDWTWIVPGNACVALLAAGWLAGRGPLSGPGVLRRVGGRVAAPRPAGASLPERALAAVGARPGTWLAATLVVIVALMLAVSEWQPLRSTQAVDHAFAALQRHDLRAAIQDAVDADGRNPLSVDPLFDQAVIYTSAQNPGAARAALVRAVERQPANPQTWIRLGEFDLDQRSDTQSAFSELRPALYLDPRSYQAIGDFLTVIRRMGGTAPPTVTPGQTAPPVTLPSTAPQAARSPKPAGH